MTKRTLLLIALGTASVAALTLYAKGSTKPTPTPLVSAPESGDLRCEGRVVTYPGADVVLSAEYGGHLAAIPVQELDQVRAGQVVARLDSREQAAQLAAAQARLRELDAELRFQELEQTRHRQLLTEGAVGQRSFDDADAKLRLLQARKQAAQAGITQLEAALSKHTLVAPFAGTVVERLAQPGELLPAGGRLLRLADLNRLRVEAEVDEYELTRLKVGSPVKVEIEGQEGTLQGRVEEIPATVSARRLKALDPSRATDIRVALVKVRVETPQCLTLGQRVELSIAPAR